MNRYKQKSLLNIAAFLPVVAFGIFMGATRLQAGEIADPYCYYDDKKYSPGTCLDMNCCFFCWDDDQRCSISGGVGIWGECGGC